ncbi:uncharacterized protein LOC116338365, partial [Contarinia nasturtii]|uniref:uncharacterized protein LOC116338365 n=1 Tax=Contarinia nasturtii TaxID=265458 RepID=UPI0012D3F4EF
MANDDDDQNAGNASNVSTANTSHLPEISRITIKAPTFVKNEPDLFFIQMEAQFRNAGISNDNSKYNHVIAALEPQYLSMVSDLVRNPPTSDKYDSIKKRLIDEYTQSDQKKLRVLLTEIELGDDKPSHLLRKMRDLAKNSLTDDALKSLWIDRLPENVRAVVAISNDDLTTCSNLADKILELTTLKQTTLMNVNEIKTDNFSISELKAQINELSKSIRELKSNSKQGTHSSRVIETKNRSRSKSRGKSPYCYFHYKFGAMARKCEQP